MQHALDTFTQAYNKGSIGSILKSLSSNVEIDNSKGKYLVSQAYINLFQTTDSRNTTYSAIKWKVKDGTAYGRGRYKTQLRYIGSSESSKQGRVSIELSPIDGGFQIKKIDHTEKR